MRMAVTNSKAMIIAVSSGKRKQRQLGRRAQGVLMAPACRFSCCQAVGICQEDGNPLESRGQSWRSCPSPFPGRSMLAGCCLHHLPHSEWGGRRARTEVPVGSRYDPVSPLSFSLMSGPQEHRQSFCSVSCSELATGRSLPSGKDLDFAGPFLFSNCAPGPLPRGQTGRDWPTLAGPGC